MDKIIVLYNPNDVLRVVFHCHSCGREWPWMGIRKDVGKKKCSCTSEDVQEIERTVTGGAADGPKNFN